MPVIKHFEFMRRSIQSFRQQSLSELLKIGSFKFLRKKLRSNAPPKHKCLLKEEAKEITQTYEHRKYGAFDQRQEPVEGLQMV